MEPSPEIRPEPEDGQDDDYGRHAQAFSALLLVLILVLLGFLYAAMSRDRDKERAKELFAQQRHQDALGYLKRSEQAHRLRQDPELFYMLGAVYERLRQPDLAGGYYLRLLKDFVGTAWEKKGKEGILRIVLVPPPPGPGGPGTGSTVLINARDTWHRSYNRLVSLVRENRSGVSADLEQAYREYKAAHEGYVREIKAGMMQLDRGSQ